MSRYTFMKVAKLMISVWEMYFFSIVNINDVDDSQAELHFHPGNCCYNLSIFILTTRISDLRGWRRLVSTGHHWPVCVSSLFAL